VQRRAEASIEPLETRRLLTVLTFDPVSVNGVKIDTAYGDRVTAASQNGFSYGTAGGATQNVTASFGPTSTTVHLWDNGYGDLTKVAFPGDSAGGLLDVSLNADFGYQSSLSSFDLAGTQNKDWTIKALTVFDGGSNVLFTQSNVAVKGVGHTHFTMPAGIQSRTLRIRIDTTNLPGDGDQIGIDNVQFSQVKGASRVGDGFADVVLAYHDSGAGGTPGPYGGNSDSESAAPVGLGVVLGNDPDVSDYLSLPTGSFVTVGFSDETIVDGSGVDLAIRETTDAGEMADVYISSDFVNFTLLGTAKGGRTTKFDFATIGYNSPVRAVKIVGLDSSGASPGFDLVNVQALASAQRSESFRYPIGDGTSAPTIQSEFGSTTSDGTGLLGEIYATPSGKNVFPFMFGVVSGVTDTDVTVRHTLADGTTLVSTYRNLSQVLVSAGKAVTITTKLGLTGTGGLGFSVNLDLGAAVQQFAGAAFSSTDSTHSDAAGQTYYKPSTFVSSAGALNVSFADLASNGALTITGTGNDDVVDLTVNDTDITVSRNGVARAIAQSTIKSIVISTYAGNDQVTINGPIIGSYVDAGEGNDIVAGGNGKDTLTGGAGKNTLIGNLGDDRLNGSGSRDSISGGDGSDRLYGNGGDDTLSGEAGVDRLFGGDGNDLLQGGSSNDKLYGEGGKDTLQGNNQDDSLEGGSGDDSLIGGGQNDTVNGNDGNDIFEAKDGSPDVLNGGDGQDKGTIDKLLDTRDSIETLL
jgi:Ca2+-binding RTX toxin-like protein